MTMKPYLAYPSDGRRSKKTAAELIRSDFSTDLEWTQFCAEQGIPWSQIHLALKILVEGRGRDRVVEAYMWLYLARLLDPQDETRIIDFLSLDMSLDQVEQGISQAELWIEDKWDKIQRGQCDYIRPELRKFFCIE